MADLSANQLKAFESLRSRLLALKGSMSALGSDLNDTQQPLPSWTTLQRQSRMLLENIQAIVVQTQENDELLESTVAFPTPDFPAPTSNHIITALLRTKHEPNMDEWIGEGEKHAQKVSSEGVLPEGDREELWASAAEVYHTSGRKYPWGADYTREEMQNGVEHVVTGLRRELVEPMLEPDEEFDEDEEEAEDEGEENDGQDDKMDVEKPTEPTPAGPAPHPRPMNDMLRFLATGSE